MRTLTSGSFGSLDLSRARSRFANCPILVEARSSLERGALFCCSFRSGFEVLFVSRTGLVVLREAERARDGVMGGTEWERVRERLRSLGTEVRLLCRKVWAADEPLGGNFVALDAEDMEEGRVCRARDGTLGGLSIIGSAGWCHNLSSPGIALMPRRAAYQ